jgi:hypothetical protein
LVSLILPTGQGGFDIKQLWKNPLGTKNAPIPIKLSACCFSDIVGQNPVGDSNIEKLWD